MSKNILLILIMVTIKGIYKIQARYIDIAGNKRGISKQDVDALYNKFETETEVKVSYFGSYPAGTSACSLDPLSPVHSQKDWITAAISKYDFQNSLQCGLCFKLTIKNETQQNASAEYFGSIVDQCNHCNKGEISLFIDGDGIKEATFQATDCPEVIGKRGRIKIRLAPGPRGALKVQIRNSKLPTVGVDIYINDKWICLDRENDNYFSVRGINASRLPITGRCLSVTGQYIGFSIDKLEYQVDLSITGQYKPFYLASRDEPPKVSCSKQTNAAPQAVNNSSEKSKDLQGYNGSRQNITNANQTSGEHNQTIDEISNSSFCRQQFDGYYANEGNCNVFYQCSEGETLLRRCPEGLNYNSKESVCDWPRNANCGSRTTSFLDSAAMEDLMTVSDKEEEVFTKKSIFGSKTSTSIKRSQILKTSIKRSQILKTSIKRSKILNRRYDNI